MATKACRWGGGGAPGAWGQCSRLYQYGSEHLGPQIAKKGNPTHETCLSASKCGGTAPPLPYMGGRSTRRADNIHPTTHSLLHLKRRKTGRGPGMHASSAHRPKQRDQQRADVHGHSGLAPIVHLVHKGLRGQHRGGALVHQCHDALLEHWLHVLAAGMGGTFTYTSFMV